MQNKIKPLTIEEVIEFKPSMENPMVVECFDGEFEHDRRIIRIIAIHKSRYALIDADNDLVTGGVRNLKHYASLKQPKEKIALYRTIDAYGATYCCDENGQSIEFFSKGFWGEKKWNEIRKRNRQKDPCAYLDPDTFEIEWV